MQLVNVNNSTIDFVEQLITQALNQNCSDIHIEPLVDAYKIRLRVDGILILYNLIDFNFGLRVISRIKVLANIDIAQKLKPQDGSFIFKINYIFLHCRISTILTINGEKLVLRILNPDAANITPLQDLGMNQAQIKTVKQNINHPHGLILATGPTGSGKTTTLYAMLNELNSIEKNIVTIEEPVEIKIAGINQIATNRKIDLSFLKILRSILRQDPDVIMLGEIRDSETAITAINAAQTGHLVLATLHTLSAIDTFMRFDAMQIPLTSIFNSLNLIIAQRLIRKLCPECKGQSCSSCHKGYNGRTGIFELMNIDNNLREQLFNLTSTKQIMARLKQFNYMSLYDESRRAIDNHTTTQEEISRVIGHE